MDSVQDVKQTSNGFDASFLNTLDILRHHKVHERENRREAKKTEKSKTSGKIEMRPVKPPFIFKIEFIKRQV